MAPERTCALGVVCGSGIGASQLIERLAQPVAVIDRHAGGVLAHAVDHRANLESLRRSGCTHVLGLNSVGSLRLDWPVGTVVCPDDFFCPWARPDAGSSAVPSVPDLFPAWRMRVVSGWTDTVAVPIMNGGVYAQTTGPRFETRSEIRWLATVADLVGMTMASECIAAGGLRLAYASISVVDNLANGLGDDPLTVADWQAGVEANRPNLLDVLPPVIDALARELALEPRPEASGRPEAPGHREASGVEA